MAAGPNVFFAKTDDEFHVVALFYSQNSCKPEANQIAYWNGPPSLQLPVLPPVVRYSVNSGSET